MLQGFKIVKCCNYFSFSLIFLCVTGMHTQLFLTLQMCKLVISWNVTCMIFYNIPYSMTLTINSSLVVHRGGHFEHTSWPVLDELYALHHCSLMVHLTLGVNADETGSLVVVLFWCVVANNLQCVMWSRHKHLVCVCALQETGRRQRITAVNTLTVASLLCESSVTDCRISVFLGPTACTVSAWCSVRCVAVFSANCGDHDQGGVQFLSDELSEVSKNRQLTSKFLRADFAAVSEVSGKNLCWVLKIDVLFMFVCTFPEIAVYRPVTQNFFPLSTESHRWETGCSQDCWKRNVLALGISCLHACT